MQPAITTPFQKTIWQYYQQHGRHNLPWRLVGPDGSFDPYSIMVSEVMLQQTQVNRVVPKYQDFLQVFPSLEVLARAPLSQVLTLWSGLGYNRRAKFLWQAAQAAMETYSGTLPRHRAELIKLPGIGPNTAGAIIAYAYNEPVIFIETNIRTVYIYHFFEGQTAVADTSITPLLQETLPPAHIREWYWALMDYGTYLKQTVGNAGRSSRGYVKQPKFHGSRRQIRGQVVRLLTQRASTITELMAAIVDERLLSVLEELVQEGLIERDGLLYRLRMI